MIERQGFPLQAGCWKCNVCLDCSVLRLHPTLVFSHLHTISMHLCDCMPILPYVKVSFQEATTMPRPLVYPTACSLGCGANCDRDILARKHRCVYLCATNQADGSFARQKFNARTLLVRTVKKETLLVFKCSHRTVMTNTLFSEWCGYQSLSNSTLNE